MSRTVHYDTNGNEIENDAPTYPQEQLADIERREAVNSQAYYKIGGIEAIDVIEAWGLGFSLGNAVKYIARCGRKSDKVLEDLKKAAWYLNREIEKIRDIERKKTERWVKRLMERKERGDEKSGSVQ